MYERLDTELIFVFTGPNGAGRKTVADMIGTTFRMKQVLSYTTRGKRANEVEGIDYHFITREAFEEAERNGEFIEAVELYGHRYGVKGEDVQRNLETYGGVYLVLNRHGAEELKRAYGDKVKRIFIYADLETVNERQRANGHDQAEIARYQSYYEEEMEYRSECEHAYENLDLAHTVYDLTKGLEVYMQRGLLELD